ncbi:coiled-coil domain-containing protein [Catellatospora sichuanensis]|uniref:coiled-coil domain-containing protein n=1 Tax=Catellatospora sichuanensis TaxID=1969805 RepID=UPI001FEBEABC|nr:hypothetical protein [Catellatospora sichuanensis]
MPAPVRRPRPASLLALLVAVVLLVTGFGTPANAEPNEIPSTKVAQARQNLESAAGQYLDAEAAMLKAKKEQTTMNQTLLAAENRYTRVRASVAKYAAEAYKSGRLGVIGVMLNANTSDEFLARSAAMEKLTARDDARISELVQVKNEIFAAKAAVDASVKEQAKHFAEMAKLRKAADKALSALGGAATKGWVDPNSPLAIPAKRNADGTWPREVCSIDDPTRKTVAGACITPRTLHAYLQAQKAGFKRYTSCWRPGDMYEHPKGRACDFSVAVGGFGGHATGGDRTYGNKLAAYFVKNASALGVMYVIWFCQVWTATGGGWHRYSPTGSSCGDSPSADHTDHVHLSVN